MRNVPTASPSTRHQIDGCTVILLPRTSCREIHITTTPLAQETPNATLARAVRAAQGLDARIVRQEVFGSRSAWAGRSDADWPVLWIEGNGAEHVPLAGIHTFAVAGAPVESIVLNGRAVGRVFVDGTARHAVLGELLPNDVTLPQPEQARQLFENLEAALHQAGMNCTDLVRTWLYLDDILGWYGPFNKVRTDFYRSRQLLDGLLPASTGIGGRHPTGAAVAAAAWATQAVDGRFAAHEIASPLQGPAPSYGSSFSRAIEMNGSDFRRVFVSGTASIGRDGRSVHVGDMQRQVELTMNVVGAILAGRQMGWSDATRVTVYVRHPSDAPAFEAWRMAQGLEAWPVVVTPATVCRDELLFEVELDAAVITP
jgi:enamine deaminase RidA (YjgF/YER057c/UK114 family)